MPVVIIIQDGAIPAILQEDTDEALLNAAAQLSAVPEGAASSKQDFCRWLATLPAPAGWFETVEAAQQHQKKVSLERDAQLVKAALKQLGVSQRELCALLGLADPGKDGRAVRRIAAAQQGLTGTAKKALAYAVKYGPLPKEEEAEILNSIGNGKWVRVKGGKVIEERPDLSPNHKARKFTMKRTQEKAGKKKAVSLFHVAK